jgi:hypothetical protein
MLDHLEKTVTPTICSRKGCINATVDPKRDGWHWQDFGPNTTLTSGWWCPGCNASLIEFTNRMVAAGHARLDRVERKN